MNVVIQGIDVVYFHARDAEKMGKWYNEVLGLDFKFKTDDHSWQEFDFDKRLSTRLAIEVAPLLDPSPVERQSIMISLRVNDVDEVVDTLENHGVEFFGTPKIKEEGVSRFATLQDPDGNWIQLSQRIK